MEPSYLQAQSTTVPLLAGMDSKSDPKAVQPPKLLDLENASFFAPGEISKDRGYPRLTTTVLGVAAITPTAVHRVIGCNGKELLFADRDCYQYLEGVDRFVNVAPTRGIWATSSVETTGFNKEFLGDAMDYAYANGYELLISSALAGSGTFDAVIRERSTGTVLYLLQESVTVGSRCAAFTTGNILGFVWLDGANVNVLVWNSTAPATAPAVTTPATDATGTLIDATPQDTNVIAIAFQQVATGRLKVLLRNVATATTTHTDAGTAAVIDRCLTVACLAASNVFVVWGDSGTGVHGAGFSSTLVLIGTAVIDAGVLDATHVTAIDYNGDWAIVYRNAATTSLKGRTATNAAVPTAVTNGVFGYSGLAHRAVRILAIPGAIAFGAVRVSTATVTPETYYTTILWDPARNDEMEPLCWYLQGSAAGAPPNAVSGVPRNALSCCQQDPATLEFRWSASERQNAQARGTGLWTYDTAQSVMSFRLDDGAAVPFSTGVALAGGVAPPGRPAIRGDLQLTSFPFAPEIISVTPTAGGGLTAAGVYGFVAVYAFIDDQGNVVQSAPSLPVSGTLGVGQASFNIVVSNPYARRSNTVAAVPVTVGLTIVLYRTQANGTTHTLENVTGADALIALTSTIVSTVSDVLIAPNQALYTDSGVLENFHEPHGRVLVIHQDRAFKIDEHTGELRYTKEILEGEGLAWHPNLALDLRNNGIDAKALVSTNNGLWVFGRDTGTGLGAIQFLVGSGPNDAGIGSSYALQRLEGVTVSCYDQRLCCTTPLGVLFWDPGQGLHLLSAQAPPVFVGAEIHAAIVGAQPIAMHVMADRKEVRIACRSNVHFAIWHYDVQQWSLRVVAGAVDSGFLDACLWNGRHVMVSLNSTFPFLVRQTAAAFDDIDGFYPLMFDTAWIKAASFKGLQRIWTITLLGRNVTPAHAAAAAAVLYYDYDASAAGQTLAWSAADIAAATDASGNVALEIKPNKQLCEAFRLHVEDTIAGTSPFGGGLAWTAIRIDYGTLARRTRQIAAAVKG